MTWYTIGPTYTAAAVAIRCMGQSSIPSHGDYTQSTAAKDLKDNLDVLSIAQTNLVVHDKGSGQTAALNAKYRTPVKRVVYSPWLRLRRNHLPRAWSHCLIPELASRGFLNPRRSPILHSYTRKADARLLLLAYPILRQVSHLRGASESLYA